MATTISTQDIVDAKRDIDDIGKAVNEKVIVSPRYGEDFKSLPLAIQEVVETGGFEPFATEAELLASTPILEKKAAKALDTKKVWYWSGSAWEDTGLSELDLAKKHTDSFDAITINEKKEYPLQLFQRGVINNAANQSVSRALLDAKVINARRDSLYRIGVFANGSAEGEGIRIQRTPFDRVADGYSLNIHATTDGNVGIDYSKGGIQTVEFKCKSEPSTSVVLTLDVDALNTTYGTPINMVTPASAGYNFFISPNCYYYADAYSAKDERNAVEYDAATELLTFKYKTTNNKYYCVYFQKKSINQTFTLLGFGFADDKAVSFTDEQYEAINAPYVERTKAESDYISPLQIKALSNIDAGSEDRAPFYTSGSHGSDGAGGGNATASTIALVIYVDDVKKDLTKSFNIRCDNVRIEVVNAVQAYNTVDQQRAVAHQYQTYELSKNGIYVHQTVRALENIEVSADNGCQHYFAGISSLAAVTILQHGSNLTRQIINNNPWNTGTNRNVYGVVTRYNAIEVSSWVDIEYGVGDRRYVASDKPIYEFPRVNGKLYPRLFSQAVRFNAGETYQWRGGYYFGGSTAHGDMDSILRVQDGTLYLTKTGRYILENPLKNIKNEIGNLAPKSSPSFTGTPTTPTASLNYENANQIANNLQVLLTSRSHRSVNVSDHVGGVKTLNVEQSRMPVITFTGTLTQDIVVEIPTNAGYTYTFRNATSRNITVRHVGYTTGIVLAVGERATAFSNGTSLFLSGKDYTAVLNSVDARITAIENEQSAGVFTNFIPTTTVKSGTNIVSAMTKDRTIGFNVGSSSLNMTYNDGETWTLLHGFAGSQTDAVIELANGELLVSASNSTSAKLWLSSGFRKGEVTWAQVHEAHSPYVKYPQAWSIFEDSNMVLVIDYGAKAGMSYGSVELVPNGMNARYAYMSLDYGKTWKTIFDLNEWVVDEGYGTLDNGNLEAHGVHCHGIAYDKWWDRIWITFGDNAYGIGGTVYSDDLGKTWQWANKGRDSQANSPANSRHQNVGIKPMPDCILFGTDGQPNGVHRIERSQGKNIAGEYTINVGYAYSSEDKLTHLCQGIYQAEHLPNQPVFFAFGAEGESRKTFIVATYDGFDFQLIWESDTAMVRGYGLRSVVCPTRSGNLVAKYNNSEGGSVVFREIKGKAPIY